jgi:hypothetical protein
MNSLKIGTNHGIQTQNSNEFSIVEVRMNDGPEQ